MFLVRNCRRYLNIQASLLLFMKSQYLPFFSREKNFDFSVVFTCLALIIYPLTVLLIPKINGLIFALFALSGLFFLMKYQRDKLTHPTRDEALFYFSVSIFFLVTLLITLNSGFVYKILGKHIHILLVVPVYIYLRYVGVKQAFLWYGLVAGAVMAMGIAVYDVWITDTPKYWGNGDLRAMGITHPIIFGNLSLIMGCMSMAGFGWFKQQKGFQVVLPVLSLSSGVLTSVLSVSRGGWVAVPFLIAVFFWYIYSHFTYKQKFVIAVMILSIIGTLYMIPSTKVSHHIGRTIDNIQQYSESEIKSRKRATSVGTRFEMWQAAWKIYLDNPVSGVGWGHYQEQARKQVVQGLRNKVSASFDHPHSEYFMALASGGSIGFIILIQLFLIPAWLFIKYIKKGETADIRRLALAGLVLIVAYMAFGLSEPMLYRSRSVNFFAFYLAVFMAAISTEQSKLNSKKTEAVKIAD